jgi:hypothetical protein
MTHGEVRGRNVDRVPHTVGLEHRRHRRRPAAFEGCFRWRRLTSCAILSSRLAWAMGRGLVRHPQSPDQDWSSRCCRTRLPPSAASCRSPLRRHGELYPPNGGVRKPNSPADGTPLDPGHVDIYGHLVPGDNRAAVNRQDGTIRNQRYERGHGARRNPET